MICLSAPTVSKTVAKGNAQEGTSSIPTGIHIKAVKRAAAYTCADDYMHNIILNLAGTLTSYYQ